LHSKCRAAVCRDPAWRETERIEPLDGQIEVRMEAIGSTEDAFKVLGVLTAKDMADVLHWRIMDSRAAPSYGSVQELRTSMVIV
jgi:hypothetical protein